MIERDTVDRCLVPLQALRAEGAQIGTVSAWSAHVTARSHEEQHGRCTGQHRAMHALLMHTACADVSPMQTLQRAAHAAMHTGSSHFPACAPAGHAMRAPACMWVDGLIVWQISPHQRLSLSSYCPKIDLLVIPAGHQHPGGFLPNLDAIDVAIMRREVLWSSEEMAFGPQPTVIDIAYFDTYEA